MKTRTIHRAGALALMATSLLGGSEILADPLEMEVVTIEPRSVFVPPGFDNNDNIQVVVDGWLPNTCYKIAPPEARLDERTRTIHARAKAYYYPSSWCAMVLVPFTQTIDLGMLEEGSYTLAMEREVGPPKEITKLDVALSASTGPDDTLYAPVKEATIDSKGFVLLKGNFSSSCMSLKEVKVLQRVKDVIEVLPIAKMDEGACKDGSYAFEARVDFNRPEEMRYLVHIRSLNGQALNLVGGEEDL